MRRLFQVLFLSFLFVPIVMAQTVTQTVTLKVSPIALITVSGNPALMDITAGTAGEDEMHADKKNCRKLRFIEVPPFKINR